MTQSRFKSSDILYFDPAKTTQSGKYSGFSDQNSNISTFIKLRCTEDGVHELLVVDLHPSVAIGVELLERLREGLDHDARTHEAVERDAGGRGSRHNWRRGFLNIYPRSGSPVSRVLA